MTCLSCVYNCSTNTQRNMRNIPAKIGPMETTAITTSLSSSKNRKKMTVYSPDPIQHRMITMCQASHGNRQQGEFLMVPTTNIKLDMIPRREILRVITR
jgi:hypothetical protein